MTEPAATNASALVEMMHAALVEHLQVPYVIFGHSMGALLAALWAQKIQQQGLPAPLAVVLSGRGAPGTVPVFPQLSEMSDEELAGALDARFGGNSGTMLIADPELRAHYMPLLRADLALVDSADAAKFTERLQVPVVVVRAASDPAVPEDKAEAWREFTARTFRVETLPGNHFSHFAESEGAMLELLQRVATTAASS